MKPAYKISTSGRKNGHIKNQEKSKTIFEGRPKLTNPGYGI